VRGGWVKKYELTPIKVLFILSMLSFSLFDFTDISIAMEPAFSKSENNQSYIPVSQNPDQDTYQNPEQESDPEPEPESEEPVKEVVKPVLQGSVHSIGNISSTVLPGNIIVEGYKQNSSSENIPDKNEETENTDENENTEDTQSTDDAEDEDNATDAQKEQDDSDEIDIDAWQKELNNIYRPGEDKVVYLTFDDGPAPSITPKILDILAEEEVKATFFVLGSNAEQYPGLIKRIYEEGHGIGNHSYSHVFRRIYKKTENYLNELDRTKKVLQSILGDDKPFILTRFPGGSFGKKRAPFRKAVNKAGYLYVDWNCINGDAEEVKPQPPAKLVKRFKDTIGSKSSVVVLMHDAPGKTTTVEALPEIIRYLKSKNYRFELLPFSR